MKSSLISCLVLVTTTLHAQEVTPGTKLLPLSGEALRFNGHDAFVIAPKDAAENTPWVFYAPTLKNLPGREEAWMIERFLKKGIAIAGIDVGESYGSPNGRKLYSEFHRYLVTQRQFSEKPVLLARSRGGLMLYSWAAETPTKVGGIAGIYPVCNIESYPGLARACGAYGLTAEQLMAELTKHNPIDRLAPLAKAKVPIHHIHGDSDRVVPLDKNSAIVAERYRELGGPMTLEIVPGQGHNMWTGWFQSEKLTQFVISHATKPASTHDSDLWLTYAGKPGPGRGKHVVLIAADQEYRSEQSFPMLAKVLSERHGFDCTVLFSVNENGEADPTLPAPFPKEERDTRRHNIPGLEKLATADCVIWLSRFMHLPDDQMQHFHNYFDSGKPIIALRTANHGFWGRQSVSEEWQASLAARTARRDVHGTPWWLASGVDSRPDRRVQQNPPDSHGRQRHLGNVRCLSLPQREVSIPRRLQETGARTTAGKPQANGSREHEERAATDCVDEDLDGQRRQAFEDFPFHDGFGRRLCE